MTQFNLVYSPNIGMCVPDGMVESFVETEIANWRNTGKALYTVFTSSELIVLAFRVKVMRGVIPFEKMNIIFIDKEGSVTQIPIDKDGRIETWPEGFCSVGDKLLMALFLEGD